MRCVQCNQISILVNRQVRWQHIHSLLFVGLLKELALCMGIHSISNFLSVSQRPIPFSRSLSGRIAIPS